MPCFIAETEKGETMDEVKLKPCPFCGKVDTVYVIHEGSDFFVACDYRRGGCGASASIKKEEYSAIKAWNRRMNNE